MGAIVDLVDKPFVAQAYLKAHPGVDEFDLIRVRMTHAFTGKNEIAATFNAPIRYVKRIEIDSAIGDGVHFGAAVKGLVFDSGSIYVHDLPASPLHWDAIQFLGGYDIDLHRFCVIQRSPNADVEGRCVFMSGGHDFTGNPDLQRVVFHTSYFESHRDPISTKSQVFTQALSIDSGLGEDCFVCEAQARISPIVQKSSAIRPINLATIIPAEVPVPLR